MSKQQNGAQCTSAIPLICVQTYSTKELRCFTCTCICSRRYYCFSLYRPLAFLLAWCRAISLLMQEPTKSLKLSNEQNKAKQFIIKSRNEPNEEEFRNKMHRIRFDISPVWIVLFFRSGACASIQWLWSDKSFCSRKFLLFSIAAGLNRLSFYHVAFIVPLLKFYLYITQARTHTALAKWF